MPMPLHKEVAKLFSRQLDLKLNNIDCLEDIILARGTTTLIGNVKIEPDVS
jgi:hypothetical protein